jgi:hypothetical protein
MSVPCKVAYRTLDQLSTTLHQNIEATLVGDDPFSRYVPWNNHAEGRKRVALLGKVCKAYSPVRHYFFSDQPVGYMVSWVKNRISKLEGQLTQVSMFDQRSEVEELEDMKGLLRALENPWKYFEEMY